MEHEDHTQEQGVERFAFRRSNSPSDLRSNRFAYAYVRAMSEGTV
jgi:hypothetical protein